MNVLLVVGGLIAVILVAVAYGLVLQAMDVEVPDSTGFLEESTGLVAAGIFLVIIVAPVVEETFFRGFVFRGLQKRFGFWGGGLASAGLFAVFHIHPLVYIPIFTIGLILAWVYARSGSLWTSIQLHMAYNAIVLVIARQS